MITDVLVTRSGMISAVAWNPDGSNFAAATSVGLFLYNGISLELDRSFNVGESYRSVLFSPDDGLLVSGGLKGDIQWVAPDTGKYITTIEGHLLGITDLAFPKQSGYLISGSDDGTVRSWNPTQVSVPAITEYSPINIWRAHDRVTSVDINQNFQFVVAGSYQTWFVWDLITGESIFELDGFRGWINDLSLSPGGEILAVADRSNQIRLWETASWNLTHDVQLKQVDQITALDFSPDGWTLALGGKNGTVLVWDVRANTLYKTVENYPHAVTDIEFHPNGDGLIISYDNGLLRLWSNQQ
jgi:WD40 repeat protein